MNRKTHVLRKLTLLQMQFSCIIKGVMLQLIHGHGIKAELDQIICRGKKNSIKTATNPGAIIKPTAVCGLYCTMILSNSGHIISIYCIYRFRVGAYTVVHYILLSLSLDNKWK